MMKKQIILALLILTATTIFAQSRFYTRTGKITFSSKAPLEDIEGKNKTVTAVLDATTGAVQFAVQMKGFEFEKQMMQQHFNENYVESDKFPKAEFKGNITNNGDIDYTKDGSYTARIKGKLTIHGVTRDMETTGTIRVDGGKIDASSVFSILCSDYNIRIPSVVKDKVSNSIHISVDCSLEALKG